MESKKVEAARAKEMAERKFIEGKFSSSKKYVLKAQNLWPELEGLSDLLTTLNVHISAENKIAGERDWYGILGVNPLADDETVKKQYRKLALTLHPDRNKCTGADGAFNLVSEAWSLLSDKAKRLAYNQKRDFGNGPHRTRDNRRQAGPASPAYQRTTNTFWTVCNGCRTHYEYLRMYVNHTLLCPNCHEAFFATERAPPPSVTKSTGSSSRHNGARNTSEYTDFQHGGEWERTYPSKRAGNHLDRVDKHVKKRRMDDNRANGFESYAANGLRNGVGPEHTHGLRNGIPSGHTSDVSKPNRPRELSVPETRIMLMEKARIGILDKLKDWNSMARGKENNGNSKGRRQSKTVLDSDKTLNLKPTSMNVPDSDFHNFDMDRTKKSFGDDQVWAAYDDNDGMPRYYARIHKVMSLKPFRMRFSWLNSRSSTEFGTLDWVGSGFTKTLGDFRTGKYESIGSLNSFSHRVEWTKGNRGVVCIYPRKGDVWALYRNWAPDWNEHTSEEIIHKYDMVEVLDDYNEEQGVLVTPLVKVPGFQTVFHKHTDPNEVRKIPKEEMFRFSHQVPNYLLTGEEAPNAPKGCRELDPAATPLEFIRVINKPTEKMLQSVLEVEEHVKLNDPYKEQGIRATATNPL